jgi:hypothetical protein
VFASAVLLTSGCGGSGRPSGFVVATRPLSVASREVGACLRLSPGVGAPTGAAVERIGRRGRSVTFRAGTRVVGCDGSAGQGGRWCASTVGLLRGEGLADPRLSLVCRVRGKAIGFGWIEPVTDARWIVVREAPAPELYRVVPGLPVRITTARVGLDSAVFDVAQYTGVWRELERRRIVMRVAG